MTKTEELEERVAFLESMLAQSVDALTKIAELVVEMVKTDTSTMKAVNQLAENQVKIFKALEDAHIKKLPEKML